MRPGVSSRIKIRHALKASRREILFSLTAYRKLVFRIDSRRIVFRETGAIGNPVVAGR